MKNSWKLGLYLSCSALVCAAALLFYQPQETIPEETLPPETTAAATLPPETTETVPQTEEERPWNLILVNPGNYLPEDFQVELESVENGHRVDKRIVNQLKAMLRDARKEGLEPLIISSYRTMDKQDELHNNRIKRFMEEGLDLDTAITEAGKWVAVPGTSEHQTGLAVDIVAESYPVLEKAQEDTPEQIWLMENSWKYGFIMRYPSEKSHLTGIHYEPWHYRYVGGEAAEAIHQGEICLEEYLG